MKIDGIALLGMILYGLALGADPWALRGPQRGTLEAGVYRVEESISIIEGDTLVVPAGSELRFTALTEAQVEGALVCDGGRRGKVKLISDEADPGPLDWNGIIVKEGGTVILHGAVLKHANFVLQGDEQVRVSIDGTTFQENAATEIAVGGKRFVLPEGERLEIEVNTLPRADAAERNPVLGVRIGLGIGALLAAGAGVTANTLARRYHEEYMAANEEDYKGYKDRRDSATVLRNAAYIGAGVLAAGLAITFVF